MRFERAGDRFEICVEQDGIQQICEGISSDTFTASLHQMLDQLAESKIISNLQEITTVGIRVVAPGTYFQKHHIVDGIFIHRLREHEPAAPLHIPHTLAELAVAQLELPHAKIVAVSDSAFHATLPPFARDYSIEAKDTTDFDIHRFGYHGISVSSIMTILKERSESVPERLVIAHVGSGVSMTALRHGVSIDTTMGFAPDSGMIMGTRVGDSDAGMLLELMRVKNMRLFDTLTYIQGRGGLKGMTGESDFRQLLEHVTHEEPIAVAAMRHFVYRFQKQLGAYAVALGGIDRIILTATAAERSPLLRTQLLSGLEWFGVELDTSANDVLIQHDGVITVPSSRIAVEVIRTQELSEMLRVTTELTREM
jgi:acetate kinase